MFKSARWRGAGKAKAVFKLQFHPAGAGAGVGVHDGGGDAAGRRPAHGADGARGGRRRRLPLARPDLRGHQAPLRQGGRRRQDLPVPRLRDRVGQGGAAGGGDGEHGRVRGGVQAVGGDAPPQGQPRARRAAAREHIQRVVGGAGGGCGDDGSENGDTAKSSPRRTLQSQLSRCEDEEAEKARSLAADSMSPVHDGLVISKPPGMRFPLRRNMPASVEPAGHLHNANGFDAVSLSGSDGSSGRFTPKTSANMHSTFLQDATNVLSPFANNATSRNPLSSGDWSGSSAPDASTDGSTSNSGETGLRGAEDDVEKLRSEIGTLTRKLDVSDMELQTLRKQIVKESRRGQDLSKEMSSLRDERDALRGECEGLRGMKKTIHDANGSGKRLSDGEDPWSQVEELKQELGHEKNLNADLRVQLQKMQESNSELLLAVKDLDEMLEQKNRDMSILQEETVEDPQEAEYEHALSNVHSAGHKMDMSETSSYQEKEDELMLDALVKKSDGIASSELQEKILELSDEIELYKKDREDLEMQMEQLALDYEILKQENHDISSRLEQTQLREQLRMQYECSAHLSIISDLEANVENLENELQEQSQRLEADIAEVLAAKVEQEQRAIKAEESLRKARWNNATTAERLQEEFKSLSSQVSSAFSANERLLVQARKEAAELQLQKSQLEELLQKAHEDAASVQEQHRVKIQQLLTLVDFKSNEIDRLVVELKSKSDEFENQKRSDESKLNDLSEEIEQLKAKIDKLSDERDKLVERNEQKDMELAANGEKDMILQDKTGEITLLNKELALLKDQMQTYLEELNTLKRSKSERDETIGKLQITIGSLKLQYDNMKNSLSTKEAEKSNLASQVLKLRRALESREGAKENGVTSDTTDNQHTNSKRIKHDTVSTGNGDAAPSANGHSNGHDTRAAAEQSSKELESLKETNKAMQQELNELHERYSEISLKFAEVEGERQQLVMTVRTLKNSLR
ncbi:unnamed protein product [Triticum turgidum subsp. durum]|uniref:Uncharacterized protein n=1 Tax=Triticum turgidum subsp. durum TaxID=4567 RepID=A0A9R0QSU3_TRITD|nr:unnamed protein product [Triticum turgidum subsp. durum]